MLRHNTIVLTDKLLRSITIVAIGWFVIAFVLLHIVREDLSLWHTTLSIYAVGPAGWVLKLGFYTIALAQGLIAYRDLKLGHSWRDRFTAVLLLLAASGAVLVASYPYTSKFPHNTGAVMQLGLFPLSLLLRAFWLKERTLGKFNSVMAVLCSGGFLLLLLNDLLRDYEFYSFGLFQKGEIVCITVWLLGYAWYMPKSKQKY
jgi:hypothetical protein